MQFQIVLNWLRKAASLHEFEPLGQNDILSSFHALSREFFVLLSLFLLFWQFLCSIWTSSLWHYQQSLHPPDQLFKSCSMFGICQVVWHPTSTSIVLAVLPRAEFVRGLLSEQDALQERLNEIEDTLQLFRSQPAYWDVSSMASARAAAESLLERIEEAQEDCLILVCLYRFQAKDFPKSRWTAVVSDWIVCHAPVFLKGFCENQWHRDDLAEKTNRLLENPEVCLGLQPLLPSLGSCCRLSFSLESVAKMSLEGLVLCIAQCDWDRGLCLPRGSDQIQFGSHFW